MKRNAIKIQLILLALAISFFSVFLSGCIELKPREGVSDTIHVTITQGSDTCVGSTESTCGAFLKEKRTATSDFVCEGPVGPKERELESNKYSLTPESGWSCEQKKDTMTVYLDSIRSNTASVSSHCNGYKNWHGSCKQSGPCPVGRRGSYTVLLSTSAVYEPNTLIDGLSKIYANCNQVKDVDGSLTLSSLMCGIGQGSYIGTPGSFLCNYEVFDGAQIVPSIDIQTMWLATSRGIGGSCGGWTLYANTYFTCSIYAVYETSYECKRVTGESYKFVNCSYNQFSSFQGGTTYLDSDTPYSELSSYLQSYYGSYSYNSLTGETEPSGTIQVPFFMLGQGPTFTDYEEAKKLCTPYKEQIINISLGNTTFDPPILIVPKMEICLYNGDETEHYVELVNLQNQQVVRQFSLVQGQSACFKPNEGYYHLRDSNKDYASLSILASTETSQIYVGSRIVPNYTLVNDGGSVNFSLLERIPHNLTMNSLDRLTNNFETNITLNLTNKFSTMPSPPSGEYGIKDNSTGQTGYLFVQSITNKFVFKSDGSVLPNYTIYRPLGDTICFTSESGGVSLNISRMSYSDSGNEWVTIYANEPLPIQPAYCCIQGVLAGKYQAISNDGRIVNWTIGTGKPSLTINIQSIGFEPELMDSEPGTKVCWVNPSTMSRDITTLFSKTGKMFFSAVIPPLSDNVCNPTAKVVGSYLTSFVSPPLSITQVLNLKELGSKEIAVTSGGFDSTYLLVQPGQQVCWTNVDTQNHTLMKENGNSILLHPQQTDCIPTAQMMDSTLFSRQFDNTEIYSYVAVLDGNGAIISSKGPIPSNVFIQLPETNMSPDGSIILVRPSYFKLVNKQSVPSELYEVSTISLSGNNTGLAQLIAYGSNTTLVQNNITTYTKVQLIITNNDNKNHTLRVENTGDIVNISSGGTYLFELNDNAVLTDLTIEDNLTISGITNQTIIDAFSKIAVFIVGPREMKFNSTGRQGDSIRFQAPLEPLTAILYENNTGLTLVLTFTDTKESMLSNPLNNITLDLPVQVVHGDLSSDILSSMREYADEGAMSMLIPSFNNVTVTISSAVFTPPESSIPAGSTITITNKDVISHTVNITKNTSGIISMNFSSLLPLDSYQISNTPKNTTFYLHDQESNLNGNITIVAYDANIGVSSTPVSPQMGMVAVGGPVKFNNYDATSVFNIDISLTTTIGEKKSYSLSVPKYTSGLPGQAVWIPDSAGDATYVVKNSSNIIGSGNITVRNSIINVSMTGGKFEFDSLAIDHESQVCFLSDSVRTISITNLDTTQKIASVKLIPSGSSVSGEEICNKVYNCTTKPAVSSEVQCGGIINESDDLTHCYYNMINPSQVCKVNTTWACVVNPTYASDLECASDYTIDTNPSLAGIQPQCWFKANPTGTACMGASVIKDEALGSIINCSVSTLGELQFGYFAGMEKTSSTNPLCTVTKIGSSINCVPTNTYSDIGCTNGSAGDAYCYYTPSPLTSAESANPYTTINNRFCNVGISQKTQISYNKYLCNLGWCSAGSCCTCPTSQMCGDLPCDGNLTLGALKYTSFLSYLGTGCIETCSGTSVVRTCGHIYRRHRHHQYNYSYPGFAPLVIVPSSPSTSWKVCKCYQKVSSIVNYVSSCSVKTGGSGITPFPSSCVLANENCRYSSPSQYLCSNESSCPCQFGCGKKVKYSALGNINCAILNDQCTVISNYNQDDGKYCQYSSTEACVPQTGYADKVMCGYNGTVCSISKSNDIVDDGTKCDIQLALCESKYKGVDCSYDASSNTCKAFGNETYCFTPASTYIVEDIGSGDTLVVKGYDRYTPLEIDIQKSELTPSSVTTSPLSDVCFVSLDGKQHVLTMPSQINEGNDLVVNGTAKCLQFPYNTEPWIVRLKDNPNAGAEISSIKEDVEIIVKSQLFNPSDIILRPGTTLTFANKDNIEHTLLKSSTSLNGADIKSSNEQLTFSNIFTLEGKTSWIDDTICRNDSDCPKGSFCDLGNKCHPLKYCLTQNDCPISSVCYNNICILSKSCGNDSDCKLGDVCSDGRCIAGTSICNTDGDCPLDSLCMSGNCTRFKSCSNSTDCPSGTICFDGFCAANMQCSNNSDCPINSACISNICSVPFVPECNNNTECPNSLSCVQVDETEDGTPINACVGSSCDANSICTNLYPNKNISCMLNYRSGESNCTLYDPSVDLCSNDNDCLSGACIDGKCVMAKSCSFDTDCPLINGIPMACMGGYCKIPLNCTTTSDCPINSLCNGGYCRALAEKSCTSDEECELGDVCFNFKCVSKQNCSSTTDCNSIQSGSACTNESSTTEAFCKSSLNCTSDAYCPAFNQCSYGQCISYPKTTCGYPMYGTNVSQFNFTFNLPESTFKIYIKYSFNDNGRVVLNGQDIVPTTRNRCQYETTELDNWSAIDTLRIPLSLIKTGSGANEANHMSITVCSCSGEKGVNASLYYQYVDPAGISQTDKIILEPSSTKQISVDSSPIPQEFAYIDEDTLNALPVSIKECSGSDLRSIAFRIKSYERLDYASPDCDSGKLEECKYYNPYGPATVAFISTESGLNLTNSAELACALEQALTVDTICSNCTIVLDVGSVNITELNSILQEANITGKLDNIDVIGYDVFINDYPTCDFEEIMNSVVNQSKLALYNYSKPSILMRFGFKSGNSVNTACNWTDESIVNAYTDFYGLWIPILAGSGVLGTAQYCLTDPCPSLDFYGLLTEGKTNKAFTDAWFKEGCGRYYYNAEGLSFTTFSMKETNYSMCDPSRMLALLQTAQCAVGKYTLKSGTG